MSRGDVRWTAVKRLTLELLLASAAVASDPCDLGSLPQIVPNHIVEQTMKGQIMFLSSGFLAGRSTPSRGLDVAAGYIAAEFRRVGLIPAGEEGYFQRVPLVVRTPNREGFSFKVVTSGKELTIDPKSVYWLPASDFIVNSVPLVVLDDGTDVSPDIVDGKVIYAVKPSLVARLQIYHPTLVIVGVQYLPESSDVRDRDAGGRTPFPVMLVSSDVGRRLVSANGGVVALHSRAANEIEASAVNVAGLMPGSDPLKRTAYIILSAHYDHLGIQSSGEHRVYPGANDNASGTTSILSVAGALASIGFHPQRSILFIAFMGEEVNQLGSRYYVRHPLVPLEDTVAAVNLEQVGRPDISTKENGTPAFITGFGFSSLPSAAAEIGSRFGVAVLNNAAADPFFSRSDNFAFAEAGVPAHTIAASLNYPDYHRVSDSWDKLNYPAMRQIGAFVAGVVWELACNTAAPHWNEIPDTRPFMEAAKRLHDK